MESANRKGDLSDQGREKPSASLDLEFVRKKAERIIAAVYLLSDFFPDQEPLKWKLRERALSFMDDVNAASRLDSDPGISLSSALEELGQVRSLLSLSNMTGFISAMNFSILDGELSAFKDTIASVESQNSLSALLLSDDFLEPQQRSDSGGQKDNLAPPLRQGGDISPNQDGLAPLSGQGASFSHVNKGRFTPARIEMIQGAPASLSSSRAEAGSKNSPRNAPLQKQLVPESRPHRPRPVAHMSKRKNDRAEAIIRVLRKKDNLTIKDIAAVVSGCSEKTIQRELVALVNQNVLKRVGERRWSRYLLA